VLEGGIRPKHIKNNIKHIKNNMIIYSLQ
jgi:hypothetical protein